MDVIEHAFHVHQEELPSNLNPAVFSRFLDILNRWNQVYNLTAIRNREDQIKLHLIDSLLIGKYLKGTRFLDVGSGGGFPGIPLAIAYPHQSWTLLDKSSKKTRFLTQAVVELELKNVDVIHGRVEDYQPEKKFDGVTARAFSSLLDFVEKTRHLISEKSAWYAMKGVYPEEEIRSLPETISVECIALKSEETRHLVCMTPLPTHC